MGKKKLITLLLLALIVPVVAVYGISYVAAYKVLHSPRQATLKTPADYGLDYEKISFESTDKIPLKGWWIPSKGDAVIFVIHGYGANKAGWLGKDINGKEEYLDWLASAPSLNKAGFNLVYFDLRASGESGGDMITLGKYEANDLMGAVKWVLANKKRSDGSKFASVGLLGMSMGGNVSQISPIPVMFIQAEKDEIGDIKDVQLIFKNAGEPKKLVILPNALRFEAYRYPAEKPEKVISFFSKHLM
ncbi:MAG: alpha/beta hydrolase [Rhizobiaceae bacterium]